jgi:hypothetical protein
MSVNLSKKTASLTTLLLFILAACSQNNADSIYDAQACLDKATSSTAMGCYQKVSGINTASADLIRCASILVYEGFGSASLLQNALNQLQGGGANVSNTMNVLRFYASAGSSSTASTATDLAQANDAANQCSQSGSTGLSMLASLASVATAASQIASSGTISATTVKTNAQTIINDVPSAPQLLQTTYQQNCTGTVSSANQSYCTQYAAALAQGGNSSAVALYFLQNLN